MTENEGWANWRGRFLVLAAVVVVALSGYALSRLLDEVNYDDLADAIIATPWRDVVFACIATAVSFLALSVYDRQALAFVDRKMPYPQVALASFCAYAVGNVAGFGPLTGGTVRYRFYAPLGASPEEIAKIVGYVTVAFGIGLAFVTSIGLVMAEPGVAHVSSLPPIALRIIAVVVLGAIASMIAVAAVGRRRLTLFGRTVVLPSARDIVIQLAATTVDVVAAATVLWVLLPDGDVHYFLFLSVYAVAIGIGVLSHVPGGVGVFETVIIAGLGGACRWRESSARCCSTA